MVVERKDRVDALALYECQGLRIDVRQFLVGVAADILARITVHVRVRKEDDQSMVGDCLIPGVQPSQRCRDIAMVSQSGICFPDDAHTGDLLNRESVRSAVVLRGLRVMVVRRIEQRDKRAGINEKTHATTTAGHRCHRGEHCQYRRPTGPCQ